MNINCLVQVTGNNELDFAEWLDYHIALGFNEIYVFDTGDKIWLDSVCERRRQRVVRVPKSDEWKYKSSIIQAYIARLHNPEWCICMDDHDFIWIDPRAARNIREYISRAPENALAVTFYTKHMSSVNPMKNRVGTQIDCFTHIRREPEGFLPAYKDLPNTGITMFRVVGPEMPMKNAIVPTHSNLWVDAMFNRMSEQRLIEEMGSKKFSPMSYPVRCYRYGIRSGIEMGFNNDMVPRGFDIVDLSMQQARMQLLRVPVNQETEKLFAKDTIPDETAQLESVNGTTHEVSANELAERSLPITRARIDKLILKGQYFEDICKYVDERYKDVDKAALERVFNAEREAIIKSSSLYTQLQEFLDEGKTDAEIMKLLMLKETTLANMKLALAVLDIHTNVAAKEMTGAEALAEASKIEVKIDHDTSLTDAFNATVAEHEKTELEQKAIDAFEAARIGKQKGIRSKKKSSVAKPEKKVFAAKAISMTEVAPPTETAAAEPPVNPDVNVDDTFVLDVGGTDVAESK